MAKARGLRTVFNLLLVLLLLLALWIGLGQPLPWKWDYRRMERAMLLEPMEIVYHDEADDMVLSVNDTSLGLFTGGFWSSTMITKDLFLFPLKDGVGRVLRHHPFWGLDIWAYDTSGRSTRVEAELQIWDQDHEPKTFRRTAAPEEGVFFVEIDEVDVWNAADEWKNTALEAMVAAEVGINLHFADHDTYESGYAMTLTFYDEAGNVTAVHESEGTYAY